MHRKRGALALELEDDQPVIVASSEKVQFRMRREHPETIVLSPERLDRGALGEVPHANGLVLTAGHDQLVFRVEKRGGDVVEVTSACIDLPGLRLAHPPNLDLTVVRRRNDEGEGRVERRPVHTSVMAFEDVLNRREVVEGVEGTGSGVWGAFPQPGDVPDTHGLVLGRRYDEIFLWMELSRHHVVRVAGENGDAVAGSAVPDADSLVVGAGELASIYRSTAGVIKHRTRLLTIHGIS